MIISASRRTDIPTYYSDWFYNRIKEGFVYVRNPMNVHHISKVALSPDVVDGIVFWTKNPRPMIDKLSLLKDYMYYFQFTVNSYARDIESNIPSKKNVIIPTFLELSRLIGPERVIWRYDPILLSRKYSVEYHARYFEELAGRLSGYTSKCVISFVDLYRNTQNNAKELGLLPMDSDTMYAVAKKLVDIASKYNIAIESCAEEIDLERLGIKHGHCIDRDLFEKLLGCKLDLSKDKNQREECGCMASVDIGMYNTCKNGCKYCYANYSAGILSKLSAEHDSCSPLLSGVVSEDDIIKERVVKTNKERQTRMFE